MTDAKYFANSKKGEIFELKGELNSDKKEKRKEAVKKVIASMTVGKGRDGFLSRSKTVFSLNFFFSPSTASKDVSSLFPGLYTLLNWSNLLVAGL